MKYKIKDWHKFQHFKDRKPPWIKLYRDILDDKQWFILSDGCKALLVQLWLLASESDGELPEMDIIAFRLRIDERKLKPLIINLSHWLMQDDINLISERYQSDIPETETERETETDTGARKFSVTDLMSLWNEKAYSTLPRVSILNKTREAHIKARLASMPEKQTWEDLINKINASLFLTGQSSHWKCDFDWVMNPTNLTKILEGNYDNNRKRG